MVPSEDKAATGAFVELALTEAIARCVRVWLIVKPSGPRADGRLFSRLLAAHGPDKLALDIPRAGRRKRKVFVPADKVFVSAGSVVGMAFSVGNAFFQARTTVCGHCQLALYPTRRVDALILDRPRTLTAAERRGRVRLPVDPSRCIPASLWPIQPLKAGEVLRPRNGRLFDYSPDGLGIRLDGPLKEEPGAEMLIRLEHTGAEAYPVFRGVLAHCSLGQDDLWLAGFGQVVELASGEEIELTGAMIAAAG